MTLIERIRKRIEFAELDSNFGAAEDLRDAADEIERLRAALKPFADELDALEAQRVKPPFSRALMFASEGGGTFMGICMSALYNARAAYQQTVAEK